MAIRRRRILEAQVAALSITQQQPVPSRDLSSKVEEEYYGEKLA